MLCVCLSLKKNIRYKHIIYDIYSFYFILNIFVHIQRIIFKWVIIRSYLQTYIYYKHKQQWKIIHGKKLNCSKHRRNQSLNKNLHNFFLFNTSHIVLNIYYDNYLNELNPFLIIFKSISTFVKENATSKDGKKKYTFTFDVINLLRTLQFRPKIIFHSKLVHEFSRNIWFIYEIRLHMFGQMNNHCEKITVIYLLEK